MLIGMSAANTQFQPTSIHHQGGYIVQQHQQHSSVATLLPMLMVNSIWMIDPLNRPADPRGEWEETTDIGSFAPSAFFWHLIWICLIDCIHHYLKYCTTTSSFSWRCPPVCQIQFLSQRIIHCLLVLNWMCCCTRMWAMYLNCCSCLPLNSSLQLSSRHHWSVISFPYCVLQLKPAGRIKGSSSEPGQSQQYNNCHYTWCSSASPWYWSWRWCWWYLSAVYISSIGQQGHSLWAGLQPLTINACQIGYMLDVYSRA